MEKENYTEQFFELMKNGQIWNRENTVNAYDLLHGAFYNHEVNINNYATSKIYWGVIHLLDILRGESIAGENGEQSEIRDSLLAVAKNLNVITEKQKDEIIGRWYKSY